MNVKQPYVVTAIAISFVVIVIIISTSSNREVASETTSDDRPDVPKAVSNWPQEELRLGQVSGVAVNSASQPVIFHRPGRSFDQYTFNASSHYQHIADGPITEPTVLTLDPRTGKVVGKWGANFFYMPHGLTIDKHDNMWITDVAMHQGFKFKPGELEPSLVFGEKFQPGSFEKNLCMPTSFAIASTGEIFLADGYCNSRILKFNAAGQLMKVIPNKHEFLSLQIPHGLALLESIDRICIADRENMRVVCPRAGLYGLQGRKEPPLTIQEPDMGKVYDVSVRGNLIYAINGPTSGVIPIVGLTIDPQNEKIIDRWSPPDGGFNLPHAIAVCPNGSSLYVAEINPNKIWKFELVPPK
ncbi:hypothetical protein WA026_017505 [Henosepilachna vigintioctopunctata]|uniref:peptidylamidoglycolate lyase n=1 Tax=Henosepilachna vigintioctopunctata TaxID=420089 RepID=A0AAW1V3B1_9CUCU